MLVLSVPLASGASAQPTPPHEETANLPLPLVTRFENFGDKDGIPSHKIHFVLKTRDGKVWLGTNNGLCVRESDGKFRRYGPEDGLSHQVVLGMAEDLVTGDLWVATMQGLNRFSGGKFTVFTQTNSGLPNNVVFAVAVIDGAVWAATPAGAGIYRIKTKSWTMYDQTNADFEEPWIYAVAPAESVIYIGVWAGGVVEFNPQTGLFRAFRDPDGDTQVQVACNSGPISDITSWIAYDAGILWQSTYFGLARYDTKEATWKTWVQDKTPLVSKFVNTVYAHGRVAWVATDRGVSVTDGTNWVNYTVDEKGQGVVRSYLPGKAPETRTMATALANGFVMAIWADDHEAWFATSNGLSHGIFAEPIPSPTVASNP
jgi:ligand-binding sensor domain-containing protein